MQNIIEAVERHRALILDAERARQIKESFTPLFGSKEEHLAYVDALNCAGERITYREDGHAKIVLDSPEK